MRTLALSIGLPFAVIGLAWAAQSPIPRPFSLATSDGQPASPVVRAPLPSGTQPGTGGSGLQGPPAPQPADLTGARGAAVTPAPQPTDRARGRASAESASGTLDPTRLSGPAQGPLLAQAAPLQSRAAQETESPPAAPAQGTSAPGTRSATAAPTTPTAQPAAQSAPAPQPANPAQAETIATQSAQLQQQAREIQSLQAQVQSLQNQLSAVQGQLAEAQGTANAAQGQLQAQDQARAAANTSRMQRLGQLNAASQAVSQAAVQIEYGTQDVAASLLAQAQDALATASAASTRYARPREATAEQAASDALADAQSQLGTGDVQYAKQSLGSALQWIAQARGLAATPESP